MNLKSTVNRQGKYTTQIWHFVGGVKATYHHLMPETLEEGEFIKIWDRDGRLFIVSRANLLFTEVFKEDEED